MKKRGAISYYILAVVALLLVFALFSFSEKSVYDFSKDILPKKNLHPVESFVQECVKEVTFEGVNSLGRHSGYMDPKESGMSLAPEPTESSGVFIGSTFIPYWYYLDDEIFDSKKPPLCATGSECISKGYGSIEEQLTLYINENIGSCIDSFSSLENEYEITDEPFLAEVNIREDDILVKAVYPLDIVSKEDNSRDYIKNFNTIVDIPLTEMYSLAQAITDTEIKNSFIENHILNMLSIYSGIESDLPPMAELEIGSNDLNYWVRSDVEDVVKNDILDFVRLIQIVNTDSFNPIYLNDRTGENRIVQGVYNAMSFGVSQEDYEDLQVSFLYPSSNIKLTVDDSEIIFPENKVPMSNLIFDMMHFTLYDYSFDYDLSFPVLVTIVKKDAYLGRDLSFRFAIEANIQNNLPLTSEMDIFGRNYERPIAFSQPDQLVNRTINIMTADGRNAKPLKDVKIYYACGDKAFIGDTEAIKDDRGKDAAAFSGKLPFCMFGGKIIAEKEGYLTSTLSYDNHEGTEELSFDMQLYPVIEKKIEIRKIDEEAFQLLSGPKSPLLDFGKVVYENSRPLGDFERVIFNINRVKSDPEEEDIPLMSFIDYNAQNSSSDKYQEYMLAEIERQFLSGNITQEEKDTLIADIVSTVTEPIEQVKEIELAPGNYSIESYVMNEKVFTIPKKVEEFCPCAELLGVCTCEKEEVEFPEQKFDIFPIGGSDHDVIIEPDDLYSDEDTLVFFVFTTDLPSNWDEFQNMRQLEDYDDFNYIIKPYFKD